MDEERWVFLCYNWCKYVENNLSLISYIEAMPLTINEVSSIIKTKFNNAGIKIVSNIQLTTQKIEEIKKEIGVEDEKEN